MTNFWPYFLQREREVSERKNAVIGSFLRPAFQGPVDIISARLWSSPENEKQLTVALRFGLSFWIQCVISTPLGQILADTAVVCTVCYD